LFYHFFIDTKLIHYFITANHFEPLVILYHKYNFDVAYRFVYGLSKFRLIFFLSRLFNAARYALVSQRVVLRI